MSVFDYNTPLSAEDAKNQAGTNEGAKDVGNNSTKKQPQTEAAAGIPEAHEHRGRQKNDQPQESQGKDAPLGVERAPQRAESDAVRIPKERALTEE
jgi:hypothetical protein